MPTATPLASPTPLVTATAVPTPAASMGPIDVRITGWDEATGAALELAFMGGLAFAVVLVALVAAASLTILTRRGS